MFYFRLPNKCFLTKLTTSVVLNIIVTYERETTSGPTSTPWSATTSDESTSTRIAQCKHGTISTRELWTVSEVGHSVQAVRDDSLATANAKKIEVIVDAE